MSAAVDISILDAHAQQELHERYRKMMHKAVDTFVDSLAEDLLADKKMTLMDITRAITKAKPEFLAAAVEEFIRSKHGDIVSQTHAECPCCGKKARRYQEVPRTIETLLGTSTITRAYYYCAPCKHGFYPLDAALGLSPRKKQDDLQSLALEFLAKMPFEEASALFLKSTGISFSDNRMHGLFADFMADTTVEEVIPAANEIERRIKEVTGKGKRRPVLVAATDGAHTPTRPRGGDRKIKWGPGEYKEAKGFRLYLLDKDRIVHIASWHQVCTAEELGQALKIAASRIPVKKVRPCLVGDGAPWEHYAFLAGQIIF